ncbi:MAG: FG-GAP-like repeat-containing protein [Deltaproteobacteria bacterium]
MKAIVSFRIIRNSFCLFSAMFLLISLASCGGGGNNGGPAAHAPSISGLTLAPGSVNLGEGNGKVQVQMSLQVTDSGGDLASVTITVYDSSHNVVTTGTGAIPDAAGIKSATLNLTLNADTSVADIYTFELYVADNAGSHSNHLNRNYTVVGPVSIAVTPGNQIIGKGATQQYEATGTFPNNGTQNLTTLVTWSSSGNHIATVNGAGLATGIDAGSITVTAALGGISGSTSLKIVPGFAQGVKYTSASNFLADTAVGDLNGDGRKDVAVIAWGALILTYYQNSQGILESAQIITTDLHLNGTIAGITIADVNNDGLADLIISGTYKQAPASEGRINVYLQDPVTHALGSPQKYALSSEAVGPLAVADLNGDGLPEIAAAGVDSGGKGVLSFLFQTAGGILAPEITYTNVAVITDGELHIGDMNNDGRNDIVLQSGSKQLAVIKQTASGVFSANPDYYTVQTSYWPEFNSFFLGDLNGDGRIDMVVADPANMPLLNIFYQNTSGALVGPTILTLPVNSQDEVDLADLDGDGLNDIIILTGGNSVNIFYQLANHTFSNGLRYLLPTSSTGGTSVHQALTVADVTGDGLPDIVASWSNDGIFVLRRLP